MNNSYVCLTNQVFVLNEFELVPIRYCDRYLIMQWRNDQIYHLRQADKLTTADQDSYFENVIIPSFNTELPGQILFSLLKEGECVAYGGLVHIDWEHRTAEISFVMNTEHEDLNFESYWNTFLILIERVAFLECKLSKINTYAFDLRPKLYSCLEINGFLFEKKITDFVIPQSKNKVDVIIHSKWNNG